MQGFNSLHKEGIFSKIEPGCLKQTESSIVIFYAE